MSDDKLREALVWAVIAHGAQSDAGGRPFLGHPLRVLAYAACAGLRGDELIAAALHDVVEDTDFELENLSEFGPRVIELLALLTHTDEITYAEYIERIATSGDTSAIKIKLCDLQDNMDPRRVDAFSDTRSSLLQKRYAPARERLLKALTNYALSDDS